MSFKNSLDFARWLDEEDELKNFRDEFIIPVENGKQKIYFLGNSLGLQPKRTQGYLQQVLDQWAQHGVEGFFTGEQPWLQYHDQLIKPLAKIAGALPHEVVVMNQLTINMHLLLVSFYRPEGKRKKILCEAKAFPSDQYMLETHIRHHGLNPDEIIIEIGPRQGEHHIRTEDILSAIDQHKDELALVFWGGVNYYSGQVFDMQAISAAAKKVGAMVGFDLAHGIGNIPVHLHDWDTDFACWCSYKYLNSGTGAIGGVYIHERYHHDKTINRFAGWWGYEKSTRFLMEKGFKPIETAEGWQVSTPSPFLYAAHKAALEIVEEAGWEKIQHKRKQLNNWLWFLLDEINAAQPEKIIEFITPRAEPERGCQVSMHMLRDGKMIFDELAAAGVMTDWREPNVIRLAPAPLYNSFEETWQFAAILQKILQKHSQYA
jgi:kynureninase